MTTVVVVLATYNGAAFLGEQLASLVAQERRPDRVLLADDGSTDGTLALLTAWSESAPFPVEILPPAATRQGPAGNFSRLLIAAAAGDPDWVLPCDQDDVWFPSKIAQCLARASGLQADAVHLLVHDLHVSDRELRLTAPSFWHHQAFNAEHGRRFATLLLMNSFPGCAMMASRGLLRIALPIPQVAVMHDWWLALVAAGLGTVTVITDPLGAYRQHGRNAVGANPQRLWSRVRAKIFTDPAGARAANHAAVLQARALRRVIGTRLVGAPRRALGLLAGYPRLGVGRRLALVRAGVRKTGCLRALHALIHL